MDVGSFYWYDYETFGADPRRDRPAQFAGIRTDTELNPVSTPLSLFCRPAPDFLPTPDACLITGITPQRALRQGIPEVEFIAVINGEFSVPGTCVVGYNNLRFDDEITRHCLYRNLFDPYAREWRNGNSRWDLIDMFRLACALRPEGINWPANDAGHPSFKLEHLTEANGILHSDAHDAISDVQATITLARLLRSRQPRLFQFLLDHRGKRRAADLLGLGTMQPVIHASEKFAAENNCIAIVVAVAPHPTNPNGVVTFNLASDPTPLLTLDPDSLRERLYTPATELPGGVQRLPLKTVHLNRCPVLAPMEALRPADIERLGLDLSRYRKHLELLKAAPGLALKVREILGTEPPGVPQTDPDLMLYTGPFFSDIDRSTLNRLHLLDPWELGRAKPAFEDSRLSEMLFRFRARNYPETLNTEELARWEDFCKKQITIGNTGPGLVRDEFKARLRELEEGSALPPEKREIIASLWAYLGEIAS